MSIGHVCVAGLNHQGRGWCNIPHGGEEQMTTRESKAAALPAERLNERRVACVDGE